MPFLNELYCLVTNFVTKQYNAYSSVQVKSIDDTLWLRR